METKWEKERNYFPKLDDFFSFLFFRNSQLFYSFTIIKKKLKKNDAEEEENITA